MRPDRILGIDYGERRVGFAVSDPGVGFATPLCMIEVQSDSEASKAVQRIVGEQEACEIVVGLPLNMDGTRGPMALRVEGFVQRLHQMLEIPVRTWDERLSSSLIERTLIEADLSRKKRKKVRDMLAAQVILQGYLDSKP